MREHARKSSYTNGRGEREKRLKKKKKQFSLLNRRKIINEKQRDKENCGEWEKLGKAGWAVERGWAKPNRKSFITFRFN